jgi:hypothetical protein
MKRLTKLLGITAVAAVMAIGTAGCDNPAGGGGGGGFDSALAAKWYLTQAAADSETNAVFEITADGRFFQGQDSGPITITLTTANGRVTAATSTGGTSNETGSAAYAVDGNKLTLSDLSGAPNIFSPLSAAGGVFYKKGGGGSGSGGAKTLVIQNIPAGIYSYAQAGGGIGIIPAGTPEEEAFQQQENIAVAGITFDNANIEVQGNGPYTLILPLHIIGNSYIPWTGSGTYDVYAVLNGGGGHYYKAPTVNLSSGTTYINFSNVIELFPYTAGGGGEEIGGAKTLVIQNVPAGIYSYAQEGGGIGIIPAGTPEDQAFQEQVAGITFEDGNIEVQGNGPYTLILPLHIIGNSYIPWTGIGTYDVYAVLFGGGGHYYKAASVNFSSGTTYINFSYMVDIMFSDPPITSPSIQKARVYLEHR